jgi:GNAT superfamily N-acetyltransferase
VKKLQSQIVLPIDKHLADIFTVDYLAVHPIYWRRGHGTSLLAWAAKLADEDKIQLGVASVPMGVKNAEKVGCKEREVIEVEGYPQHPESFKIWIGVREPRTLTLPWRPTLTQDSEG